MKDLAIIFGALAFLLLLPALGWVFDRFRASTDKPHGGREKAKRRD